MCNELVYEIPHGEKRHLRNYEMFTRWHGKCFVAIFIQALVNTYQKIQSFAALTRSLRSLVRLLIFLNPCKEIVYEHIFYFCVAEPVFLLPRPLLSFNNRVIWRRTNVADLGYEHGPQLAKHGRVNNEHEKSLAHHCSRNFCMSILS